MIVTCPACTVRYVVNPAQLGATGRTVRCARCAETWHQDPPPDSLLPMDEGADPMAAPDRQRPSMGAEPGPVTPPSMIGGGVQAGTNDAMPSFIGAGTRISGKLPALRPDKRRWPSRQTLSIAAASLAPLLLVSSLFLFRHTIIQTIPATQGFYSLLGFSADPYDLGLDIINRRVELTKNNGQDQLIVSGEVANHGSTAQRIPKLRILLLDDKQVILDSTDFNIERDQLLPGETSPFRKMTPVTKASTASVKVNFITE